MEAICLNFGNFLVESHLAKKSKEAIVGFDLAKKIKLNIWDTITFMGTTMNNRMTFETFTISGIVRFGL